jgi:hypothetical protein
MSTQAELEEILARMNKEDNDAKIRHCSYHRLDYDRSVIWFDLEEHVSVDYLQSTPPSPSVFSPERSASHRHRLPQSESLRDTKRLLLLSLGALSSLPLEILHQIIQCLDMQSIFRLRQTNIELRTVIDSERQYCLVTEHALDVFCALLRSRSAHRITLTDFYQLLCSENCELCSSYGNLVHLPHWIRCCSPCLHADSVPVDIAMTTMASIKPVFNISQQAINTIPKFRGLSGPCANDGTSRPTYSQGFRWLEPVSEWETIFHQENPDEILEPGIIDSILQYSEMACCAIPFLNTKTDVASSVQYGISCAGCQIEFEQAQKNPRTLSRRSLDRLRLQRDKVYSEEGFLKHFVNCSKGQLLYNEDESLFPEFCRLGGLEHLSP